MAQKSKYIISGVVYGVAAVLISICGFFMDITNVFELAMFITEAALLLFLSFFIFCLIHFNKKSAFIIVDITLSFVIVAISIATVAVKRNVFSWLMFSAGVESAFCYILIIACNIGYKGERVMAYWEKLVNILWQIILLPVSIFVNVISVWFCFAASFLLGGFITSYYIEKFKQPGTSFWHVEKKWWIKEYETQGYGFYRTKTLGEIKDSSGNVVGRIEGKEYVEGNTRKVPGHWGVTKIFEQGSGAIYKSTYDYEKGERDLYKMAVARALFAVRCRIVSLILSIFALFIPNLYVSARTPKRIKERIRNCIKNGEDNPLIYDVNDFVMFDTMILTERQYKEKVINQTDKNDSLTKVA